LGPEGLAEGRTCVAEEEGPLVGWPQERWIAWISQDEDSRRDWTLLGTLADADVASS